MGAGEAPGSGGASIPVTVDSIVFQGPVLRRMRAEQAWDSLLTLAYGSEIDDVVGGDGVDS